MNECKAVAILLAPRCVLPRWQHSKFVTRVMLNMTAMHSTVLHAHHRPPAGAPRGAVAA
jgi:hypothetical protein